MFLRKLFLFLSLSISLGVFFSKNFDFLVRSVQLFRQLAIGPFHCNSTPDEAEEAAEVWRNDGGERSYLDLHDTFEKRLT